MVIPLIFALLSMAASTSVSPKIDCNDGGFYIRPDPESCSNFYKCDNGNPVLFTCPSGLYFNPVIHVCDWPRNVKCTIGSSQQHNNNQNPSSNTGQQSNNYSGKPSNNGGYQDSPSDNGGQQYNNNNGNTKPNSGQQYNHNNGNTAPNSGGQYDDYNENSDSIQYEEDNNLYNPVQPLNPGASDTEVGPSIQEPLGPLDRPRPTIDQLFSGDQHPYQEYLNPNQNIDIRK